MVQIHFLILVTVVTLAAFGLLVLLIRLGDVHQSEKWWKKMALKTEDELNRAKTRLAELTSLVKLEVWPNLQKFYTTVYNTEKEFFTKESSQ